MLSWPSARADRALLDDVDRRGQRAGAQQQRQIARLARLQAGDLEAGCRTRRWMVAIVDDLLVRSMSSRVTGLPSTSTVSRRFSMNTTAMRLADVGARGLAASASPPRAVELDVDLRALLRRCSRWRW